MKNKKQDKFTKKIFVASLIVVCSGLILTFASENHRALPHTNQIDTKISQYSDRNITKNAIATNKEFKDLAFEPVEENFSFTNQIAAAINSLKSILIQSKNKNLESGTWIWTPIMQMTPEYMDKIISGAKSNGINVIYLSIDSYLDIFVIPKGEEREKQRTAFIKKLEKFISLAKEQNIAVDAEGGWRNWAEEGNTYKAFAIVSFAKNFNDTQKSGFRGFQYDVEPYLLDSYQKNKEAVLKNFLNLVDETAQFLNKGKSNLQFSVVVPDFYDGQDKMTPQFEYDGKSGFTFDHLLKILDKRENSSVIIMSYRNFALGPDGTIEISANEMQTAKSHKTKIIIAQETGEVLPPYITFFATSKKYLLWEINKITGAFSDNPNFGGIAIHYANSFLTLK